MKHSLQAMSQKSGHKVRVIDITHQPLPNHLKFIRSVPVTVIRDLPFIGKYTEQEMQQWLALTDDVQFRQKYLSEQLNTGELSLMTSLVKTMPGLLKHAIPLLADKETPMQVKIGITALFEAMEGSELLSPLVPDLRRLANHEQHNVLSDVIYLLSLIHDPELRGWFESLLSHKHEEIRELARDALEKINV